MSEVYIKKLGDFDLDDVRRFAEGLREKHDAALAASNTACANLQASPDDDDEVLVEACEVASDACDVAFRNEWRFDRAAEAVVPLLEANPGWTWRTAVEHMRSTGTLPSLD